MSIPMQPLEAYLILIRHGSAQDTNVNVDRPLTDQGILEIEQVAKKIISEKIVIDQIYHSGILRALQTAEIVQKRTNAKSMNPLNQLQKEFSRTQEFWQDFLDALTETTVLVGHWPSIGQILMEASLYSNFDFPTGGTICLKKDFNDLSFVEMWSFSPPKER